MKWYLLFLIPLMIVFVSAYTPPNADSSIDLVFTETTSYTPPNADSSIDLVFDLETPTDSCTYGGTGTWNINCADNCNISTITNLNNNAIIITGTGTVKLTANLINTKGVNISGIDATNRCIVTCNGGCFN